MSRTVQITFVRSLKSDEENKLIGRMKGFREEVREGLIHQADKLTKKQRFLNAINLVGMQAESIKYQILAICAKTKDSNGRETSKLDERFSLVNVVNGTYEISYPNTSDLIAIPGGKGLAVQFERKIKNEIGAIEKMVDEAGLGHLLKSVKAND